MRFVAVVAFLLCLVLSSVQARVTRVEVSSRVDVMSGKTFGQTGAYERITGRVFFSLPVENRRNAAIVDLRLAENLREGAVEFSAEFVAVRPKDPSRGNGSMLLEVPNRGRVFFIALVDGGEPTLATDVGDAWFLRNGYTVVSLGWQWDATGDDALRLFAPIAKERGKSITGLLRGDIMPAKVMEEIPLGHYIVGRIGGTEYAPAAPDDPRNVLTVRDSREGDRTQIPRADWQFTATRGIRLKGGFQPGKLYEYVYVVADPVIAGLGMAAVRDFASYVKYEPNATVKAARVLAEGISQNGRFLRHFLYQGFNADENGRKALDGVLSHVAGAGRGSFNHRFAQPSRDAQPTSSVLFPTDVFPFTDMPQVDPLTGEKGGLLDRARADNVVPKIFFSNNSYEYWGRAAALIHTTADGKADATLSPDVRIYHFTGLQHSTPPFPPAKGKEDSFGQNLPSTLAIRYFWRAMITNMDAWVRNGTEPPASSYPKVADGTLVPLKQYAFPELPRVNMPYEANGAYRLDFGPRWKEGIVSNQPPKLGQPFPVLVPQVDADGNERAGIRSPQITVPLATYASWNLRDPSIGAPRERVAFQGSYFPFPRTEEERRKANDPRQPISDRYSGREDYLARYQRAVNALVKERWILEEDVPAVLQRGAQEWDLAAGSP